jgi:formamidopyrimidine-DNA glycosylase
MPELPEVETIRRQLAEKISGKTISFLKVIDPAPVRTVSPEKLVEIVKGAKIEDVGRRAKILLIRLSTDYTLLVHLKLTGRLIIASKGEAPSKHCHLKFRFEDGNQLFFCDIRKFGYVKPVPTSSLNQVDELKNLGPEPLDNFTFDDFKKLLATRKKGRIKPLLMNQEFIAGIGNVYADEILFFAGVKPERDVSELKEAEIKKIYEGIQVILPAAVVKRGSSVDDYVDIYGRQGDYVPYLRAYGRTGKPCFKCGTLMRRIKLGGRSAHYCPKCQR